MHSHARRNRLNALARYAAIFAAPGFRFAAWTEMIRDDADRIILPECQLSPEAESFVAMSYEFGWVIQFDWAKWRHTKEGVALLAGADCVAKATNSRN
jgi:hypothetical protein